MTNGLYTIAVGLIPQMAKQEIIANNLANINTTGYKKDGLYFKRILEGKMYHQLDQGGSEFQLNVEQIYTSFQQGALTSTGNRLDVALSGRGFFAIQTPQGIAYTRNGNFTINPEGQVVSNAGYPVLGEDGKIEVFNAKEIQITEQGEIFINGARSNKFLVKNFAQPEALKKNGNNLFVSVNDAIEEIPADNISFKQGFLEHSNVNSTEEMVEMLMTLRRFQAIQKTIKLHDETLGKAVNELGRVS